jgi:hypothetical protein
MANSSSAMPLTPSPAAAPGDRRTLLAGVTFLEETASGRMSVQDLRAWFQKHIVSPGLMPQPVMVNEPMAGSLPLHPDGAQKGLADQNVQRMLFMARSRVVSALRGLIAQPVDDRFLAGAIFAGRVRRRRVIDTTLWVSRPEPTAPLSGIVLSLFAVDVLSNRDEYDRHLCVCDVCGRVSFQVMPMTRRHCPEHPAHDSGFMRAVVPHKQAAPR